MSRGLRKPDRKPLIALVDRANRALQADMVRAAHEAGHTHVKPAHNAVFATLRTEGSRASDMAARAGITRQSMGEIVREMAGLGLLEMKPDPADRRAKLVTYTDAGLDFARDGFRHIIDVEERIVAELGAEDYETARRVPERGVALVGG